MNAPSLSRGLGFFSLGLGLAELLAPRQLARALGLAETHDPLLRSLGARELASGLALLSGLRTKEAMWSRVAGDAMDLGLMTAALASPRTDRRKLTVGMLAVAGVTALDIYTSVALTRGPATEPSWRYTPAGGRRGLPATTPTPALPAAPPAGAQPLELTSAAQTAEPLR